MEGFLRAHRDFLEYDGRHHLWVASVPREDTLVYDRRNIIFGYGPLEEWQRLLQSKGFRESPLDVPDSHAHFYRPEYDEEERRVMGEALWKWFPLQDGDTG